MASVMLLAIGSVTSSCSDDDDEPKKPDIESPDAPDTPSTETNYFTEDKAYGNFYAYNMINDIYLWKYEVEENTTGWSTDDDPIQKVAEVRYKENSKDVDRWTQMTDNYENFIGSVDGVSTTYGYDLQLYWGDETRTTVVGVVLYTYADSPARKAGLKRGDVITTVNGQTMTDSNYTSLASELFYSSSVTISLRDSDQDISMNAIRMYEDPVLLDSVYDVNNKKIAYLAYTSFTLDSNQKLIDTCKKFKQAGATELIIDLRYNGGGYVITLDLLASMLAPWTEVQAGSIFETEIWNKDYMEYYQEQKYDLNTYFETLHEYTLDEKKYSFDTSDANIGLNKIYALVSSSSASASESLLVGLMPYMDIDIIGEQTHGKYCSGYIMQAKEWFEDMDDTVDAWKEYVASLKKGTSAYEQAQKNYEELKSTWEPWSKWKQYMKSDWGIYVMISTYADRDGNNPCRPDGLTPNFEVADNPVQPYQLGDDREAMLRAALTRAGKTYPTEETRSMHTDIVLDPLPPIHRSATFGKLIHLGPLNFPEGRIYKTHSTLERFERDNFPRILQ